MNAGAAAWAITHYLSWLSEIDESFPGQRTCNGRLLAASAVAGKRDRDCLESGRDGAKLSACATGPGLVIQGRSNGFEAVFLQVSAGKPSTP